MQIGSTTLRPDQHCVVVNKRRRDAGQSIAALHCPERLESSHGEELTFAVNNDKNHQAIRGDLRVLGFSLAELHQACL